MTAPAALVFDHDGVLVDSEPIAIDVWCTILNERGVRFERSEVEAMVGLTDAAAYALLAGRPGLPAFPDFLDEFERRRDARFEAELRPFPDAWESVRTLAAEGIPMAVATNATRELLELSLGITGLGRYFDTTVARTDVVNGKPAPDVYLEAASRLGVEPSRCMAIEDTSTGAQAAAAAGMRVVTVARNGSGLPGYASMPAIDADSILSWMGLR